MNRTWSENQQRLSSGEAAVIEFCKLLTTCGVYSCGITHFFSNHLRSLISQKANQDLVCFTIFRPELPWIPNPFGRSHCYRIPPRQWAAPLASLPRLSQSRVRNRPCLPVLLCGRWRRVAPWRVLSLTHKKIAMNSRWCFMFGEGHQYEMISWEGKCLFKKSGEEELLIEVGVFNIVIPFFKMGKTTGTKQK